MKTSESINEIAKALASVQGTMRPALKDSVNPFFKSNYANIASVWAAIREPLHKNEVCVLQEAITTDRGVSVLTRLIHSSGQWIEHGPFEIGLQKKDAHSLGSATSYAKRYSLFAALGIVSGDDDDDGNIAKENEPPIEDDNSKKLLKEENNKKIFLFLERHKNYEPKLSEYIKILAKAKSLAFENIALKAIENEEGFLKAFNEYTTKEEK